MLRIDNRKLYYLLDFDLKPLKIGRDKLSMSLEPIIY
jgi:hypothetical protein